jgi:colicin import membrane protein
VKTLGIQRSSSIFAASALAIGLSAVCLAQPANASEAMSAKSVSIQISNVHESALSQANAVRAAKQYIHTMPFSRTGLINQLKFDGYSRKDATFAVDHVRANWNTEAVLAAKQYLKTMPFSRSSLIGQLVFDGFTKAQATYGVKKSGL